MSDSTVEIQGLMVGRPLAEFISNEALPGSGVPVNRFWSGFSELIHRFGPRNRELLAIRESMQSAIDNWHREHRATSFDVTEYRSFLEHIGYLSPYGEPFTIDTKNIDPEVATIAGPQLVVPLMNARYALNAANARWGSLYDALYGTDAVGLAPRPGPYDKERGSRVIAWVHDFLDSTFPLSNAAHADVTSYAVGNGGLKAVLGKASTGLEDPGQFLGYKGDPASPGSVLLTNHGLALEIVIDRDHPVGAMGRAGVSDVVLESAVTVIMDCEDSVAAVDAADKALAYRNWLGLIRGDLSAQVTKDNRTITRRLNENKTFTTPDGSTSSISGRALMMIRNVGHLMTTSAVLDRDRNEAHEGLVDAMCTTLVAMHDRNKPDGSCNSRYGSIYVVKPKMHGPDEVAFTDAVFAHVEGVLGLLRNTVKIGIMDEERRTTVNLAECIRAVKSRVAFINTGYLDRTGDEIHTSMEAGPMVPKTQMKSQNWFSAYEAWNVDVGLALGFRGRAQIGKGMWAAPDKMADMLEQKIAHPMAGATCAWVPSPTAATLHATHYLRVSVLDRQADIMGKKRASLEDILTIPTGSPDEWPEDLIQAELDNNAQGILGYVVRWIDQGVGCSKVPDINDVGLMEDRATCRISSQHIANWLLHGIVSEDQFTETMRRMARVVDRQNASDPGYIPMASNYDGHAFKAACELVSLGASQPSGYTEPTLHLHRLEYKEESGP